MLRAVDFDDEPGFPAEEIDDVAFYHVLSIDLHGETFQAGVPEEGFLRCHMISQFAGALFHRGVLANKHK